MCIDFRAICSFPVKPQQRSTKSPEVLKKYKKRDKKSPGFLEAR